MTFYRIDKRIFRAGDVIKPDGAFIKNADSNRKLIETYLENCRPENKPNRNQVVKLFNSFDAAKNYWVLDSHAIFYEVEVENEILHRGDYNLIEKMQKILSKNEEDKLTEMACSYWEDEPNEGSIIEYFSVDPIVIRVVCDDENIRINAQRQKYGLPIDRRFGIL
jgi:hypothetical protein